MRVRKEGIHTYYVVVCFVLNHALSKLLAETYRVRRFRDSKLPVKLGPDEHQVPFTVGACRRHHLVMKTALVDTTSIQHAGKLRTFDSSPAVHDSGELSPGRAGTVFVRRPI